MRRLAIASRRLRRRGCCGIWDRRTAGGQSTRGTAGICFAARRRLRGVHIASAIVALSALRRLYLLHLAREFHLDLPADDMRDAVVLLLRDRLQPFEDIGREANADLTDGAELDWLGGHEPQDISSLTMMLPPHHIPSWLAMLATISPTRDRERMTAPADIEPAIESALSRVARELVEIARALERLETLIALIASAAVAK